MTAITIIAVHGEQVAYLHGAEDDLMLTLRPKGGQRRTLHSGLRATHGRQRLVWGEGGEVLYYAAADENWFYNIWTVKPSGGKPSRLTDYYRVNSFPLQLHPSGMALLTLSNLRGETNLRLFTFIDNGYRKITDYASPVRWAVYDPKGARIAYSANATYNPHNLDVYLMNADGFDKRRLLGTLAGAADVVQDWSGDGRYLALESNFDGGVQVGVLDLHFNTPHWFTSPDDEVRALAFSPDSAHLLARAPGGYAVYHVPSGERPISVINGYTAATWYDAERLLLGTAEGKLMAYHLTDGKLAPLP